MTEDLKILIVDNNDANRDFLSKVVSHTEGAEVAGTASNGRIAVAKLKQLPVDLVLLEIEMPLMDGLKTLEKLRESYPDVGVVVVSASNSENSENVIKALQMGALDFISKFGMDDGHNGVSTLRRQLMALMGLFRARRNTRLAKQLSDERSPTSEIGRSQNIRDSVPPAQEIPKIIMQPEARLPRPIVTNPRVDLLAIGVSTGGPNALTQLIPLLPDDLGIPLLLVQHMPATLTASLADSLNRKSALQVREAMDGEEVCPNIVYLASGGTHMEVAREKATPYSPGSRRIRLTSDPPVNSCRPSVDVLFRSIAEAYDGTTLAVIMTGMGSDGMEGVRILKRKGCYCLAQTEDTCVVYGMPRAVIEAGLSDEMVPLEHLAQRITELVRAQNLRVK
jgi:two-component system, chemotaxis family, protein-glutamate methylesterase/glutaminase